MRPKSLPKRFQGTARYADQQGARQVILLRCQSREGQRLLGVAVVSRRVDAVRHAVADRAVVHALFVALRQILEDDGPNGLERLAPVRRKLGKVFVDCLGFAWLDASFSVRCQGFGLGA